MLLILLAVVFCSTYLIASAGLHSKGPQAIFFYNSGGLFCCIIYFLVGFCRCCRERKSFDFLYKNDKFSFKIFFWLCVSATNIGLFFLVMSYTMKLAIDAGLNIGLVISIWPLNGVFTAFLDWLIMHTPMKVNHFIGLFLLVTCGVTMSLASTNIEQETYGEDKIPAYIPFCFSVINPVLRSLGTVMQKFVYTKLKVNSTDFYIGSFGLMTLVC